MSALLPAESMALTVARAQVERGDASNIQAVLVLTVERLAAEIQAVRAALDTALMGVAENGTRFADFVDKVADACGLLDGERDD